MPTLTQYASDAEASADLPLGSLYYDANGFVKTVFYVDYNAHYYELSDANKSFMYTSVPTGYDTTSWRLEAWLYYVNGTGVTGNKAATIIDARAPSGWTNSDFMIFNITANGYPGIVTPTGTAAQMGWNGTLPVAQNVWSHVVWQSSPSTGLMTFVNGQLSAQTGWVAPWNTGSGFLCFGTTVDMQQGAFYRFEGRMSQLLLRTGANVPQYPAAGFTPPQNLAAVASGQSDVLYLMQRNFVNLTMPGGCLVTEV
jgi:hypothetical protein